MASLDLIRRIDLTSLRLFVTVCDEQHLTRAAERENIAPSALSKRLAELEAVLGAALFTRHPRGMSATVAGEALLGHARAILANVERMGAELADHAGGMLGHVRILANISTIVEFLPEDLSSFYKTHPGIRIELEERTSAAVIRGVEEGVGDIGLCVATMDSRALFAAPYRRDRLMLAVRADHPLARCTEIGFADTLEYEHIGLHQDSAIYRRSEIAAAMAGRDVKLRFHVPGFDAVLRMVESGIGIGLIPDRVFAVIGPGMRLKAIPLTDEWAHRELKLVSRDPSEATPAVRLFREHLLAGA
ncbi:LysR family transcriptional regulator [Aureimonas altamirensis]|uniref:LysR family transcriptional regulator n=1 Tax=Aureimonas altamirensis TaxID=370622 RepID=UPI002037615F|nr:LysR family transcriptional regulator [Aureimonas altamirensis]MCM2502058.1 LysR family transcriptional regulator [Aureimonas altamirensis]